MSPSTFSGAHFLLDTSVLLAVVDSSRAHHSAAVTALSVLKADGALLHIAPQNLIELWAVATRPVAANGLGLTSSQTSGLLQHFRATFALLADVPEIFDRWERIVLTYSVSGKPTHDARLVAFVGAHGLTHLLTFNARDFRRFEAGEGITVVDPAALASPGT